MNNCREQLKHYIDTMNFVSFVSDDINGTYFKYDLVNENGKYYCNITEVTKIEMDDGRPATSTKESRIDLDACNEEYIKFFASSIKKYADKKYAETIKNISMQEVGSAPSPLNKDILMNIGFKEDSSDSEMMILKSIDKSFYVDIEHHRIECTMITCTPAGDEERHFFQYVSAQPFYVHELLLALKLCRISIVN